MSIVPKTNREWLHRIDCLLMQASSDANLAYFHLRSLRLTDSNRKKVESLADRVQVVHDSLVKILNELEDCDPQEEKGP